MSLLPLLRCLDLAQTRAFYRDALGFTVADSADQTLTATFQGGTLLFTEADLWQRPPGCSGTFYFAVPHVAATYATLKDRVTIAWPLQPMSYGGTEFGITDCNGYCLAFRQP